MVNMDVNSLKEKDPSIDLENGTNTLINNLESMNNGSEDALDESSLEKKKTKKKSNKKPPKPPRPPRPTSVDSSDEKLIREINEIVELKRARVERMRALKRMKNAKGGCSSGNLIMWFIMLILCIVIIWQGVLSRGNSSLSFQGSPEASVGVGGGFISVKFYKAPPNNGEQVSVS